jgi:hypothetical protein
MIDIIKIGDKDYSFMFDMEVVWFLTSSGKIDIIKEGGDKTKIIADYNDMMELFLIANRSAVEFSGTGEPLTMMELKNGIRKSPKLFMDLQNALSNTKALNMLNEMIPDGKKKSLPGSESGK